MTLGKAHKGLWSWSRKESQGEHAGIHDNPHTYYSQQRGGPEVREQRHTTSTVDNQSN